MIYLVFLMRDWTEKEIIEYSHNKIVSYTQEIVYFENVKYLWSLKFKIIDQNEYIIYSKVLSSYPKEKKEAQETNKWLTDILDQIKTNARFVHHAYLQHYPQVMVDSGGY